MENLKKSRTSKDVATAMRLPASKAIEWQVRHQLTEQILGAVKKKEMSVTEVAKKAGTSRSRITLILKGETEGISIDVLLRVLGAVGKTVKLTFGKVS